MGSLFITYSSPVNQEQKARDFIDFKSTVLIKDGKILEDNLKKEKLSADELMQRVAAKERISGR